jgi:cbb3-type cytochrome oxidase subunit 3
MDTLIALYPTLRALWVVWFFLLFVAMLVLVLRPSKRRHYEAQADIPLRNDRPRGRAVHDAAPHDSRA